MTFLSTTTLSIATLVVLFSAAAQAGLCTQEIYDTDIALNKKLDAEAARGKAAPETQGALLHHQPTPLSVAGAEASWSATFPMRTSRRSEIIWTRPGKPTREAICRPAAKRSPTPARCSAFCSYMGRAPAMARSWASRAGCRGTGS